MKRLYQTEWQAIPFTSFANLSFFKLADATFYKAFYNCFFEKYCNYTEIPSQWRCVKDEWARKVLDCLNDFTSPPKALSVGCGLGYMESIMLAELPNLDLHCTEVTDVPLRWIRTMLPQNHCHVGYAPGCLPKDMVFDLIYCGTIDYAMPNAEWISLLKALRSRLTERGMILILSASVLHNPAENKWNFCRVKNACKQFINHIIGRKPQQFWGWLRTTDEYISLCKEAGFSSIAHGPLGSSPACLWMTVKP